eukprot:Blabericola_migrator_1__1906@NODE_1518_length_4363_cov_96_666899_g998_i0_p3_GENE_NODE_1518_length_4363_cov_96_666899_g998_i0NODE_1518_length_4363_cov_96_666899_g998_i0_p3_ORF_typecomplete_len215_score29_38COPI_assoc/PF08507_10/6_2e16TMEM72/PF16054_5/0_054PMT_4TMC/PF16192_5/0_037DUF1129/PF06570_11/0_09DUF4131/PF13567_6/16DUF4131/PF13567_6/7_8Claudin_2/PF13903_6/0_5Proton_antipo_C/PF01010_19/7e03Proton_antipo_C/PF01010_19/0_51_NODE_1518_length_4363_cov_96_666899_g998_i033303974
MDRLRRLADEAGFQDLLDLQVYLEGPALLRLVGGLAGLALAAGGTLTALSGPENPEPPLLILQVYTVLFGIIVTVNELKTPRNGRLESLRSWVFKWFPFMSVMAGKGVFMLLVGAVGMAYQTHYMVTIPAMVLALCGVANIALQMSRHQEVNQAIDKSMHLWAQSQFVGGVPGYSAVPPSDPYAVRPPPKVYDEYADDVYTRGPLQEPYGGRLF